MRLEVLPAIVDAPEIVEEPEAAPAPRAATRRRWGGVLGIAESALMAGAGLGVAAMLMTAWQTELAEERVVPGVRLAGHEVGGLTPTELLSLHAVPFASETEVDPDDVEGMSAVQRDPFALRGEELEHLRARGFALAPRLLT